MSMYILKGERVQNCIQSDLIDNLKPAWLDRCRYYSSSDSFHGRTRGLRREGTGVGRRGEGVAGGGGGGGRGVSEGGCKREEEERDGKSRSRVKIIN